MTPEEIAKIDYGLAWLDGVPQILRAAEDDRRHAAEEMSELHMMLREALGEMEYKRQCPAGW